MSHSKERKEKNCLNCNAVVAGRYCQVCGQENKEPKETFAHLLTHFISDIFHFDGQFFSTVKYLLFRPGFLTGEYVRGRRASHLNPIKMYIFTSAIFFLFFFTVYNIDHVFEQIDSEKKPRTAQQILQKLDTQKEEYEKALKDTSQLAVVHKGFEAALKDVNQKIENFKKDTTKKEGVTSTHISVAENYESQREYDSIQNTLPLKKRDGWFSHAMNKRSILINEKYHNESNKLMSQLFETFFHHFPQVLFLSLPLFALILKLLYVRRKNFYYVDHIIYTVHLYCATFIFLFLTLVIVKLDAYPYLRWLSYLNYAIGFYTIYFSYKSLRNFYGQSRRKTFFKWLLLNILATLVVITLFVALIFFAVFTV